jgi:hypothetical protein
METQDYPEVDDTVGPTDQEQHEKAVQSDDLSLSARMEKRADALQIDSSEKFEIPGYEGLLAVELRRLGYRTVKQIQKANARVKDEAMRDIYNIADQIARATIGLFQIMGTDADGDTIYKELNDSWIDLAHRLPNSERIDTTRKAILFLTGGDQRIHFFANEWGAWQQSGKQDEDQEVRRDFTTTG